MSKFGIIEKDLFGKLDDLLTVSEFHVFGYIFSHEDEILSRADWCWENLPLPGNIIIGTEDGIIFSEMLRCYIFGMYASVIIGSMSFCERLVIDSVETKFGIKKKNNSFKEILKIADNGNLLDAYIISRIRRMCDIRNNLCHEKDSNDEFRLFRRSMHEYKPIEDIMKIDAQEALCMMYGIARDIERWFPRLGLPGLTNAKKQR